MAGAQTTFSLKSKKGLGYSLLLLNMASPRTKTKNQQRKGMLCVFYASHS